MRALQHVAHLTPYNPSFRSLTTPTSPPHPTHFREDVAGPQINWCKRASDIYYCFACKPRCNAPKSRPARPVENPVALGRTLRMLGTTA